MRCLSCLFMPIDCYCTRPRPKEEKEEFDHAGYIALQEQEFYESITEPEWGIDP